MSDKLKFAARDGRDEEVKRILREDPINVNWTDYSLCDTALHWACSKGHDKVVALLLAHPTIDVNQKTSHGDTPFMKGCLDGRTSCVRLLLQDARVKVNEPNKAGYTPLWWAAMNGHMGVIRWWIASGREMDMGEPRNPTNDAIGVASRERKPFVVSLLDRFKTNPAQIRSEVRKELGITGKILLFFFFFLFFLLFFTLISSPASSLEFPVLTPPMFTRKQFMNFLDGKIQYVLSPPTKEEKSIFFESLNSSSFKGIPHNQLCFFFCPLSSHCFLIYIFFQVEQMVKCPMCQKTLDNPRTLPCLHTFCLGCLGHQEANATPLRLRCRQCDAPFRVPVRGWLDSFGCNSFVDSVLRSLQGANTNANAEIKCDLCDVEEEATMHCVTCSENLGPVCSAAHKRQKMAANHRQLSLGDFLNGTATIKRILAVNDTLGLR